MANINSSDLRGKGIPKEVVNRIEYADTLNLKILKSEETSYLFLMIYCCDLY